MEKNLSLIDFITPNVKILIDFKRSGSIQIKYY